MRVNSFLPPATSSGCSEADSWPASEHPSDLAAKGLDFVAVAEAQQGGVADVCQPDRGREVDAGAIADLPADHGRDVVSGVVEREIERAAQSSVHFNTCSEVLAAPAALTTRRDSGERPRDAKRVAEFESFGSGEVSFYDEITGHIPIAQVARKNQLSFQFVRVRVGQFRISLVG